MKTSTRLFLAVALVLSPSIALAQSTPVASAPQIKRHVVRRVPVPTPRPSRSEINPSSALSSFAATAKPAAKSAAGSATGMSTTTVEQNPLQLLQQFSIDDLNAALTDAQAQNPPDVTSINCYTALIPIIQSNVANPLPAGPGVFQLAQKVRDFKALTANLQSPTGPLASLNQACAAWVLDGVNTFIGLGAKVGLVVGTGGLGGVLPALPGLNLLPFKLP